MTERSGQLGTRKTWTKAWLRLANNSRASRSHEQPASSAIPFAAPPRLDAIWSDLSSRLAPVVAEEPAALAAEAKRLEAGGVEVLGGV
jgi:hypothetical protein